MVQKKCFVPFCTNTSENSNKYFFYVPKNENRRKIWYEAVYGNMHQNIVKSGNIFCCEDHFMLKDDTTNYTQYKSVGTTLKLNLNAIPRFNLNLKEEINVINTPKKGETTNFVRTDPPTKRRIIFTESALENETDTIDQPSASTSFLHTEPPSKKICIDQPSTSTSFLHTEPPSKKIIVLENEIELETFIKNQPSSSESDIETVSSFIPSPIKSSSSLANSDIEKIKHDDMKELNLKVTTYNIETNSRFFLGLPEKEYKLILFLEENVHINRIYQMICLRKLRLNDRNKRLAIDFGYSETTISLTIIKTIPKMAAVLQKCIFWLEPSVIERKLPISFRRRYKNIQSIIDCLEIEIEVPSNPVHQAATYSSYKSCNTAKYLISSTPHGFVNFISEGYGGRFSDRAILEDSQFLDVLPTNSVVMADRGFKNVEMLLKTKNCSLVRPPSVIEGEKLTRQQVIESRRVAALRIHIERVIRRVREFLFVSPHACVDKNYYALLDYTVIIICAIINFQGPLIKH